MTHLLGIVKLITMPSIKIVKIVLRSIDMIAIID